MAHWINLNQFCKSDAITFVVWKIWSHTPSASGSYSRQSDKNTGIELIILKFSTNCILRIFMAFSEGMVLSYRVRKQCISVGYMGKVYCEARCGGLKSGIPCFIPLLSTIVLNDVHTLFSFQYRYCGIAPTPIAPLAEHKNTISCGWQSITRHLLP